MSVVATLLAVAVILVVPVLAAVIFWKMRRRKSTFTSRDADAGFILENELYGL